MIYKYLLDKSFGIVSIPSRHILSVIEQYDKIVVYALVDLTEPTQYDYEFVVVGTGMEFPTNIQEHTFLGTVSLLKGTLILHVFYKYLGESKGCNNE